MSSNEDYLDSLLKAAIDNEGEGTAEEKNADNMEISQTVEDDPNKKMSADDIAALFAAASGEESAPEEAEASVEPEPVPEEPEASVEPEPEEPFALTESEEETVSEELTIPQIAEDDPNKKMSADDIAALFAAASGEESAPEEAEASVEPEPVPEEPEASVEPEPAPKEPEPEESFALTEPEEETMSEELKIPQTVEDDPNKKMSADDIAALFAAASEEESAPEEAEASVEPESVPEETISEEPFALEESEEEESGTAVEAAGLDVDDEELDAILGVGGKASKVDDDKDITEMIDDMDTDDADLAEISELLKKSDSNELVDDEMFSMLEGLTSLDGEDGQTEALEDGKEPENMNPESEDTLEGKKSGKKKKEKKERRSFFGRKKKKKAEALEADALTEGTAEGASAFMDAGAEENQKASLAFDFFGGEESVSVEDADAVLESKGKDSSAANSVLQAELGLTTEKEKPEEKKGFLSKLFAILTEEVEEEEEASEEGVGEEGGKPKKKKKKKEKKGAANTTDADDNAAILDEMDSEEDGKKSKKKKKEKKPKKEKVKKEPSKDDGKKLPKKLVIRIFLLCFSIMALLLVAANLIPSTITLQKARKAFYKKDYLTTYQEMYGRELNESDEIILKKATIVLKVQRKLSAFKNFHSVGMELEALNALLEGQVVYDKVYADAEGYGINDEVDGIYASILQALSDIYGISEEAARQINALESDLAYTKAVRAIVGVDNDSEALENIDLSTKEEAEPVEEEIDPMENYEDVLSEELQ